MNLIGFHKDDIVKFILHEQAWQTLENHEAGTAIARAIMQPKDIMLT